jgi:lipoyl synthase
MKNSHTVTYHSRNQRLPDWLRQRISLSGEVLEMKRMLREKTLHTVCESASCPNISHCFQNATATFMILGNVCTRHCRFCGVRQDSPLPVDPEEPAHISEAVQNLGLKHVVITSVTRDDLPDGGAGQFCRTISAIRRAVPNTTIEVLIPDFQGDRNALKQVLDIGPDILNHNIETVPRLYSAIRPEADYARSLNLLKTAKLIRPRIITKSGLMLGLGETESEVIQVFRDLLMSQCDALTIGQYLAPARDKAPVKAYLHPDVFVRYQERAESMGFEFVKAGPYVRSSYEADALMRKIRGAET